MEPNLFTLKWSILLIAPTIIKLILLAVFIYVAYLIVKALKIYIGDNQANKEMYRQYYEAEQDLKDLEAEIKSTIDTDWSKEP